MDMGEQRWEALTEGVLGAIFEVAQVALPVSYKGYKRGTGAKSRKRGEIRANPVPHFNTDKRIVHR